MLASEVGALDRLSASIRGTSALCGSARCVGRSVPRWVSGYASSPDSSRASKWTCCVASSTSRGRTAFAEQAW